MPISTFGVMGRRRWPPFVLGQIANAFKDYDEHLLKPASGRLI